VQRIISNYAAEPETWQHAFAALTARQNSRCRVVLLASASLIIQQDTHMSSHPLLPAARN